MNTGKLIKLPFNRDDGWREWRQPDLSTPSLAWGVPVAIVRVF